MREEVVSEGHRLCALEVRIARHQRVDLLACTLDQSAREIEDRGIELIERVDGEEPEVQGDLIVPAPARMQLPGDLAHQIPEAMLDDRVHILEVARPGEALLIHLFDDTVEPFDDSLCFGRRENPLPAEHPRVREAAANVVTEDAMVELERARKPEHRAVEPGHEAPGPERLPFFGHFFRSDRPLFFGAESALLGMSSDASLPSPQRACVLACVRSGRPKTRMNPSEARWSNASPFP